MMDKSVLEVFSDAILKIKQSPGSLFTREDVLKSLESIQGEIQDIPALNPDMDLPKALKVEAIGKMQDVLKTILDEELDFKPEIDVLDFRKQVGNEITLKVVPVEFGKEDYIESILSRMGQYLKGTGENDLFEY